MTNEILTFFNYMDNIIKGVATFLNSEKTRSFVINFKTGMKKLRTKINETNWYELIENFQTNSQIADNIEKELKERQIDMSVMEEINISQALELYVKATEQNLTFVDLVEDNLNLFGKFEYNNAIKYLIMLAKRKDRTVKDLQVDSVKLNILEKLDKYDKEVQEYIKTSVSKYNCGEIKFNDIEKTILKKLKNNIFLKNKKIAKDCNFSERCIENNCANIREKFGLDFLSDKNDKRLSLIFLAQYLQI